RGIKAHLTIIGCEPDIPQTDHITIIPFLDKTDPDQGMIYYEKLLNADFMILPTRADCTPVVFSEAAAFGVPVITTNTGGISSIIKQQITGIMLSLEAKAPEFADAIERVWTDKKIFQEMVRNSRSEYDKRLNWEHWIREFNRILERIVPASENSEVFSAS
ncbi:MAG TPA: glycosyltransferase family 4 protein, partial [Puia sp.]|nr:glycosyltransferase family 4 protein [Puia sp.]